VAGLPRELLHLRDVLGVHRHADHDDVRMRFLELGDLRNFLDARHAPRGPEVHHDPPALVIGQFVALSLRVGEVERRRRQCRKQQRRHGCK